MMHRPGSKGMRYSNTVSNRLTHSGELPFLKGKSQEQADRDAVNIVGGVLQKLNQLAFSRALGFSTGWVGSLT